MTSPRPLPLAAAWANARARVRLVRPPALTLRDYAREAWHVVEPATPFVPGWHLDAITDHLEAVTKGEIRNLVINMPPRHMKSLAVSVFWPTWVWTFRPEFRWLFASYSQGLSTRDSVKCRRVLESPWYRERWGHLFTLTGDQNVKTRYENTATGLRLATSVGGMATGEGGDAIVCDDPHNVKEAESEAKREGALEWWDQSMSTRGNDPKTVARVIVQQRVHEHDLTGHVLSQGGYEHLELPAEYDGPRGVTSLGWSDPRTEPGELLWKDRFGRRELEDLKQRLGSYGAAAQLQQRPAPKGGGIFKRDWFGKYTPRTLPPVFEEIILSSDFAFKATLASSFVITQAWARLGANLYWVGGFRDKVEFPQTVTALRVMAAPDLATAFAAARPSVRPPREAFWRLPGLGPERWKVSAKLVEDKANGPAVISTLRDEIPGIIAIPGNDDKVASAHGVSWYVEAGNVWLPDPEAYPTLARVVEEFLLEVERFPMAHYTDQAVGLIQMLRRFTGAMQGGSSVAPAPAAVPLSETGRMVQQRF